VSPAPEQWEGAASATGPILDAFKGQRILTGGQRFGKSLGANAVYNDSSTFTLASAPVGAMTYTGAALVGK